MHHTAKSAVEAATFASDTPHSYDIPEDLRPLVQPGRRVLVPVGQGNRASEGIVLSVEAEEATGKRKRILYLLDETPVLDEASIQLALWLRERCFATLYTTVLCMLPTGLGTPRRISTF